VIPEKVSTWRENVQAETLRVEANLSSALLAQSPPIISYSYNKEKSPRQKQKRKAFVKQTEQQNASLKRIEQTQLF